MRTFSHCARVSRSVPCTNSLSGAARGRPVFLRSSMPGLSVAQDKFATKMFSCHNNAMQTVVKTLKIRVKDKHAKVREVKFCKKCNTEKSLEAFSNNRSKPDGKASTCKVCQKTITAAWRENNPAASKAATSNWVKQNSDRYAEYMKEWRDANRAARSQYSVDWAKTNPARKNAATAKRRAAEAGAAFGDAGEIRMWYEVAEVLSRGGVKFQVDHIVPLISKDVCGLHAPWNMTVLTQRQNASKGNRWWPEHQAGDVFEAVNEAYSTQACSQCGSVED